MVLLHRISIPIMTLCYFIHSCAFPRNPDLTNCIYYCFYDLIYSIQHSRQVARVVHFIHSFRSELPSGLRPGCWQLIDFMIEFVFFQLRSEEVYRIYGKAWIEVSRARPNQYGIFFSTDLHFVRRNIMNSGTANSLQ